VLTGTFWLNVETRAFSFYTSEALTKFAGLLFDPSDGVWWSGWMVIGCIDLIIGNGLAKFKKVCPVYFVPEFASFSRNRFEVN